LHYKELFSKEIKKALIIDLKKCQEILMYRQDVTTLVKLDFFLNFESQIHKIIRSIRGEKDIFPEETLNEQLSSMPKKVTTKESFQEIKHLNSPFVLENNIISPFQNEKDEITRNPFVRIKPNQSTIFEEQKFNHINLEHQNYLIANKLADSISEKNILTPSYEVSNQSRKYSHVLNYGNFCWFLLWL
jgi:hypothetical protein